MTSPGCAAEGDPVAQPQPSLRVALVSLYVYQSIGIRQISSVLRAAGHEASLLLQDGRGQGDRGPAGHGFLV